MTSRTSEASFVTDPYRPPVGETTSNNPPFVIKGSEKFPARQGGLSYATYRKTVKAYI